MTFELARVQELFSRLDLAEVERKGPSGDFTAGQLRDVASGPVPPAPQLLNKHGSVDGSFLQEVQAAAERERQRKRDAALLAEARLCGWEDVTSAPMPPQAPSAAVAGSPPDIPSVSQGPGLRPEPSHQDSSWIGSGGPMGHLRTAGPPGNGAASSEYLEYRAAPWNPTSVTSSSSVGPPQHLAPGGPSTRRAVPHSGFPNAVHSSSGPGMLNSGFQVDWCPPAVGSVAQESTPAASVQVSEPVLPRRNSVRLCGRSLL